MRDKVLAVLAVYAEGGTMKIARGDMRGRDFYKTLRDNPDIDDLYREIQRNRADMMVDEAYSLSDDASLNPQAARERSAIRLKIAGLYDRKRYGEKVALEIDAGPNLVEAIEAAKRRVLPPPRDLSQTIDAEYTALEPSNTQGATDTQSDEPAPAAQAPDIFR